MAEKNTSMFYTMKNDPNEFDSKGVSYSEIPMGEFAFRVWEAKKNKARNANEVTPMGIWADEQELTNEDFKAMLEYSNSQDYTPTDRMISNDFIPEDSKKRMFFQGQTFGFGDEIVGGIAAISDVLTGKTDEASFGELYTKYRDDERQKIQEYRDARPGEALSYEVGGAIISPGGFLKAPKFIKKGVDVVTKGGAGRKAAVTAGTYGTVYGAGASEEETLTGIAKDSLTTGVTSSLFGVGFQKAIPALTNKAKNAIKWMNKSQKTPRLETLRIAKNEAYKVADKSPAKFNIKDFSKMETEALRIAKEGRYEEFSEEAVKGALNMFKALKTEGSKGKVYNLTQMDKLRQKLSQKYNQNPDQTALLGMINLIDDTIASKAVKGFPELELARVANQRYKKAELIDMAIKNVKLDMKGGSPMSESKLYKTALVRILKDKNQIKYFSEEEKKIMEKALEGNIMDRVVGRTADLSPNVQKVMTALAFAGSYAQPLWLIPTAVGLVANRAANRNVRGKIDELADTLAGISNPPPTMTSGVPQIGSTSAAIMEQ
jgi:hypothetical protein